MKKSIISAVLALACLMGVGSAQAAFKDFKVDLTNGNLLTETEISDKSLTTFGLAVADDGTVSRVGKDDASAIATLTGKYHSNEHGWGNFSATVAVDGPVKVSMGTCAWGGDVTIKDAAGNEVGKFNTNTGACFHGNKAENIAYGYYKGSAATTLTISGGSYTPYFAIEAVDPSTLVEEATVTYSLGTYADAGQAPGAVKLELGKTFTIPANMTVYQEGKTLVGWTDGSKNYEIGEVVTLEGEMTLTPVFVANTVTLADRKDAVTLTWDFQQRNGAPVVSWQGKADAFWVTQATIGTEVIDVKLPINTASGKCANGNWQDWCQLNIGTVITVPACKGAVISLESYNATTTTTIDGVNMGDGTNTPAFTCGGDAETVDIVIGDGSYFRYIKSVLPYVEPNLAGTTYNNEEASVIWPFNNKDFATDYTVAPEGAFSVVSFDLGDCSFKKTLSTTMCPDITFVDINSKNGASDIVKWSVKPAKGLTFTPTKIEFYIGRDGTDGTEKCVTVLAQTADGAGSVTLDAITPHRNNKTQEADAHGSKDSYTVHYSRTLTAAEQAQLASGTGFDLVLNNGFDPSKGCLYSDVRIYGILNGTVEAVAKYTVAADLNIEGAGTVTVYPKADAYDEGSEVKLTAAPNFGYHFVNWTDAAANVVSDKAEWVYTVAENSVFTANFEQVATYALNVTIKEGNPYQVEFKPAPVVVDGKNMYEDGTTVTLKALPVPVMKFLNWSDGQTSPEITVTMDGDKALTATFEPEEFLAGWDFYLSGNNGRVADFFSADNDAAALVLRDAEGTNYSWLDKSQKGAGGYEGRPAGVNWTQVGLDKTYWQTKLNAEAFKNLKVQGEMAYNYNAYTKQDVEVSTDGETWTKIGTVEIEGAKNWKTYEFDVPTTFDNAKDLYIRWKPDTNSEINGTSSNNNGIAIGPTYIFGDMQYVNDGQAPKLVSSVPANNGENASINGKIVLTFDEKVKVAAGTKALLGFDLNGDGVINADDSPLELTPEVTGTTVMFAYKNLSYSNNYTFTLPANSVMDKTDNKYAEAITIKFATKSRPVVEKALYDAVVTNVDELVAAIAEAGKRADSNKRFRIFLHNGTYQLPASATATKEGSDGKAYPDPTTYLTSPNVSFIGESRDGVIITNTLPQGEGNNGFGAANLLEGIGKGDVIQLKGTAVNTYWQNLTIKSAMGDARGRDIELNDQSDKTIMKDVCLWGYQDTYVSNNQNGRFYFEGGVLRGRTDYLCGKGDVFYNAVTLRMIGEGGYITAPSQCLEFGYVFKDCEIIGDKDGVDGNFTLGRPWGSGTPSCLWIDTKMTVKPSAIGWNEMSGGYPKRFAEYNSFSANGTPIDLSGRKKVFADTHDNNPILTKAEADAASYTAVMGRDDDWDPAAAAEQAPLPANVAFDGTVLTWDNNAYVSLWAVCADGKVIDFVTEPTWSLSTPAAIKAESEAQGTVEYSVRAANEMGGLGDAVKVGENQTGLTSVAADSNAPIEYFNLQGIRVLNPGNGVYIRRQGTEVTKIVK